MAAMVSTIAVTLGIAGWSWLTLVQL